MYRIIIVSVFLSFFASNVPAITIKINADTETYKSVIPYSTRTKINETVTNMLQMMYPNIQHSDDVNILIKRSPKTSNVFLVSIRYGARSNIIYIELDLSKGLFAERVEFKEFKADFSFVNFATLEDAEKNELMTIKDNLARNFEHNLFTHMFFPGVRDGWIKNVTQLEDALGISTRSQLSPWQVAQILVGAVTFNIISGEAVATEFAERSPLCGVERSLIISKLRESSALVRNSRHSGIWINTTNKKP